MTSFDYDIVLLPEPEIARKAIRTSRELEPLGTDFTLHEETCIPHASLYMIHAKEEDLPEILKQLEGIAGQTETIRLESSQYFQDWGYIDADYQKTAEITELQDAVVGAINPLRDGLRPRDVPKIERMDAAERQNMQQYGDWRIGELFRPHLTFARFKNGLPIPLEDMGAPTAFGGHYTRLAICEMGKYGTCIRKIKEFDLV